MDGLRDKHGSYSEELKSKLREQEKMFSEYRKSHGKLEVFFEQVIQAITPYPNVRRTVSRRGGERTGKSCVQVAQVSDWHMGEVQVRDEIEGFNEFNPTICRERALTFAQKLVDRVDLQRNNFTVDDIHIICTGDMISGDIHQELKVTNEWPVPVQVVEAGELFAEFIYNLAPHYKRVVVHYLVNDNHSRLERKPQSKQEGLNSHNYTVGKIAEIRLSGIKHVEFNLYPMYEKVIEVNGMQYLITHGHNLRGWMGIPWYSYQRHVGKEAMSRMSLIMNSPDIKSAAAKIGFHKMMTGHFHTPFNHPLYSCCGSLSGTSAYDHKDGRFADPSQSGWFNHAKYGEFDRTDFRL